MTDKKPLPIHAVRIRECRKSIGGMSQAKLADIVGISQEAISGIERGKVVDPRKLVAIAKALQTTPDYLQGSTNERAASASGAGEITGYYPEPSMPFAFGDYLGHLAEAIQIIHADERFELSTSEAVPLAYSLYQKIIKAPGLADEPDEEVRDRLFQEISQRILEEHRQSIKRSRLRFLQGQLGSS